MTSDTHTSSAYRSDIDGLRAIAVLAVLVYHAFPAALPGGFAGVDIFFVISGYLISGIILGDLKSGSFTFADFYSRRIRRIFPALILVLLFTLLVGWWGLLPAAFRQLGSHVVGGVVFVSNLVLWKETGYFDTAADIKPLLHLWSLGIEEQYYLIWPLALFAFRRHVHRMFWLIVGIALMSFSLNVITTMRYPDIAFYWPIPRFWELMVGSVIAYAQLFRTPAISTIQSQWLSTAGVLLLAAALGLLSEGRAFPGWWAVLPTGGAALLICAGPAGWFNRCVLSNRVMVLVGLISYPMYLWHWPLLTYARIFNDGEPAGPAIRVGLLVATVVLAWLTYELVEKKIRYLRKTTLGARVVPVLVASMAALGVYGVVIAATLSQARSASIPYLAAISEAFDDWQYGGDREIVGDTDRAVFFMGDSHMQQYLPRIEKIMSDHARPVRSVRFRTLNGCAPVPGIERPGRGCDRFVAAAFHDARSSDVDVVVIGGSWMGMFSRTDYFKTGEEYAGGEPIKFLTPESQWVLAGFEEQVRTLVAAGKRVVVVLTSPSDETLDPGKMVKWDGSRFNVIVARPLQRTAVEKDNDTMDEPLRDIARRLGVTTVNPLDVLCSTTECPAVDGEGAPLYKDLSHVRTSVVRSRFDLLDEFVYIN